MVAALHGDMATEEQAAAAKKMHADLDFATTYLVDLAATKINGHLSFDSVGAWWESVELPVDADRSGRRQHGGSHEFVLRPLPGLGP